MTGSKSYIRSITVGWRKNASFKRVPPFVYQIISYMRCPDFPLFHAPALTGSSTAFFANLVPRGTPFLQSLNYMPVTVAGFKVHRAYSSAGSLRRVHSTRLSCSTNSRQSILSGDEGCPILFPIDTWSRAGPVSLHGPSCSNGSGYSQKVSVLSR